MLCIISTGLLLYLLDLLVCGHRPLCVALLLEPGADGLQGAISTAPTIVIHVILHVVVVAVDPLDQVHLEKTRKHTHEKRGYYSLQSMSQYPFLKSRDRLLIW